MSSAGNGRVFVTCTRQGTRNPSTCCTREGKSKRPPVTGSNAPTAMAVTARQFGPVTLQRARLPYIRVDVAVDLLSPRMVMDFNPQHSSTSRVFRGTKGVSLGGIGVR